MSAAGEALFLDVLIEHAGIASRTLQELAGVHMQRLRGELPLLTGRLATLYDLEQTVGALRNLTVVLDGLTASRDQLGEVA